MKENRDRNMEPGFIAGTLVAAISILLSTIGIFWLLRVAYIRDLWIFNQLTEIDHFGDLCCGFTLVFILVAFAGIMQANYTLIKSLRKRE